MFKFFQKKPSHSEYQKIFLEESSKIFDNLFIENGFVKLKVFTELSQSKIIYQNQDKFIEISSINERDPRGESYFEIYIGEKYNLEINEFEGYFISVSRYSSILNVNKKLSYYAFPFGKKQCLKSLKKAKKDFIKYFEFYLTNDDNLFEKVLKLKDIRI
jgi:hypothetical protein